jgi:hypothetical protein
MSEQQTEFKSWARVEVMGHQTHIGFTETQAFGGTVLFRVDQPELPAEEMTLQFPEYVEGSYVPVGSLVKREAVPACTVLIGASSIYRIIPCDEEAAKKAIRTSLRRPLILVKLAELPAINAEFSEDEGPIDEDDELGERGEQ